LGKFIAPIISLTYIFLFTALRLRIGGIQIAGPIVLAQHKGNKRIGEAQTTFRSASHIVIEITY
jgi:hypothetical protein